MMPLPPGWSAALTSYWEDTNHVPALWWGEVTFTGPNGKSFTARGSIPLTRVGTMTPQDVINTVWPTYASYVLGTIADLSAPPAPPTIMAPIPVTIP